MRRENEVKRPAAAVDVRRRKVKKRDFKSRNEGIGNNRSCLDIFFLPSLFFFPPSQWRVVFVANMFFAVAAAALISALFCDVVDWCRLSFMPALLLLRHTQQHFMIFWYCVRSFSRLMADGQRRMSRSFDRRPISIHRSKSDFQFAGDDDHNKRRQTRQIKKETQKKQGRKNAF